MKKGMFLLLLVVAIGGGAYYWISNPHGQALREQSLTFAEVCQTTIRDIVSATGQVEPRELVLVSSETAGTIMHLWGSVGDQVTEGADLAQLDDRKIDLKVKEARNGIQMAEAGMLQSEAALTQAKAALTQAHATKDAAQRNLKIQEELKGVGGFRSEHEQAKAQFQAALAGIEAAQAGVEVAQAGIAVTRAKRQTALTGLEEADLASKLMRIKVPGSTPASHGQAKREFLILDRKVYEGQMVGPQSGPLFTLAGSFDIIEVHAQVAEGDINKIREGLKAVFNVTAFNDEESEFAGSVKRIRPLANNIKGAAYVLTIIEVKNRKDPTTGEWQLRPGMTASVDIVRREHRNVWKVPAAALNFTLDEAYQSEAARAHLAIWRKRPDERDWRTLWIWDDAAQQAQPVQVRIGGLKNSEAGIKDGEGNEILEWETGKEPTHPLRVIIGAPPSRAPGFFDQPANVKI